MREQANFRHELTQVYKLLGRDGLLNGSSGNASVKTPNGIILVTPSGCTPARLVPQDLVAVTANGKTFPANSDQRPTSELSMHLHLLDMGHKAVVHTHSTYATALACAGLSVPAFHYMVAAIGGDDIPLAQYATFGSVDLAVNVSNAIGSRKACLIDRHGVVSVGQTIYEAYRIMCEVENLCQLYFHFLTLNTRREPLSKAEMGEVFRRMHDYRYGQDDKPS